MSADLTFAPENFFKQVFGYFGTTSSSFVVFSGIIVSGLDLGDFVSPTVWLFASVSALISAYSLRRYITHRFIIAVISGCLLLAALVYALYFERVGPGLIPAGVYTDALLSTLLSSLTSFGVCFIFSAILVSYKRHDVLNLDDLPSEIVDAAAFHLSENDILFESFVCEIQISAKEDHRVQIEVELLVNATNRRGHPVDLSHRYPRISDRFVLRSMSFDGQARNVNDAAFATGDGIRMVDKIPAKSTVPIHTRLTEYLVGDSHYYATCYGGPTRSYSIKLTNLSPDKLISHMELLNGEQLQPTINGDTITWTSPKGLLPNQGARIVWRQK